MGSAIKMQRALSNIDTVFDIVIGDFGRMASIRYLHIVAERERQVISQALGEFDIRFYDEYRRIMTVTLNVLEYLKREPISHVIQSGKYFDDSILIGLGGTTISAPLMDAATMIVAAQVELARSMGYNRIRLVMPCNGMSPLITAVARAVIDHMVPAQPSANSNYELQLEVYTVPEVVCERVVENARSHPKQNVIVLGTAAVNDFYRLNFAGSRMSVLPLSGEQHALIDRAIVSSIAEDERGINETRQQIVQEIVEPSRSALGDPLIIEACTDFDLGIGRSSLKIFAEAMVDGVYHSQSKFSCGR
jgi:hypothetical protein